jgi:hypothetical protein
MTFRWHVHNLIMIRLKRNTLTSSKMNNRGLNQAKEDNPIVSVQDVGWSLSEFLFYLFRMEEERPDGLRPVERESQHARMITALLNGASKPRMGIIIDLIHRNSAYVNYRQGDKTMTSNVFSPSVAFQDIEHSWPALSTWAVHLVAELVSAEAKVMIAPETGLHLRARGKDDATRQRNHGPRATWDAVNTFSLQKLQETAEAHAPTMWHIISSYVSPSFAESSEHVNLRQYRPQNLASNSIVSMQEILTTGIFSRR